MITYLKGDLFNSPAKILVNTVNVVGVMGKGVAFEFKKRYPDMFFRYQELCEEKKLEIGNLFLWRKEEKWVLMFPTKKHWRNPSKLEYVEAGLIKFAEKWDKIGADSIAFPRLGCGNGGLEWEKVQPLMEKYLNTIPMQIYIYVDKYEETEPEHLNITEMERWLLGETQYEGYQKFEYKLKKHFSEQQMIKTTTGELQSILLNENGLVIDEKEIFASQRICEFWNYVRDAGIITEKEMIEGFSKLALTILEIMKKLQYISSVIISKNGIDFEGTGNGYQYIGD